MNIVILWFPLSHREFILWGEWLGAHHILVSKTYLIPSLSHGSKLLLLWFYIWTLLRFVLAHLEGKHQQKVILQHFDKEVEPSATIPSCCDVFDHLVEVNKDNYLEKITITIKQLYNVEFSDIGEKGKGCLLVKS